MLTPIFGRLKGQCLQSAWPYFPKVLSTSTYALSILEIIIQATSQEHCDLAMPCRWGLRNSFSWLLTIKEELDPKIDFSSFKHLDIVEQLYEVFIKLLAEQYKKNIDVLKRIDKI